MLSDSDLEREWEGHESGWPARVLFIMYVQPESLFPHLYRREGQIPIENVHYAAYTELLHHLFPAGSRCMLFPMPYPDPDIPGNRLLDFIVFRMKPFVPVLVLKVRVADGIESPATRVKADEHVRGLLKRYGETCPLPRLRAFSFFGTKLCFYSRERDGEIIPTCETSTVEPESEGGEDNRVPKEWWSLDMLEAEGANLIRQQVAGIMEECGNLTAEEIAATPPFVFQ